MTPEVLAAKLLSSKDEPDEALALEEADMEAQAVRYERAGGASSTIAASLGDESMENIPPLPRQGLWHVRLPEAYVHLALYYVALGDGASARRTFKFMLRMFPNRRLVPSAHSPVVVGLFEQARLELVAECGKSGRGSSGSA